jgi:hypothetical protein
MAARRTFMVPIMSTTIEMMNCTHSFFSRAGPDPNSRTFRKYTMKAVEKTTRTQPVIFCRSKLITNGSKANTQAPSSAVPLQIIRDAGEVLVAAPRQIDHHEMTFRLLRREVGDAGERVSGLERRDDALKP